MKDRQATIPLEAMPRMIEALNALITLANIQEKPDIVEKWEAEQKSLDADIQALKKKQSRN